MLRSGELRLPSHVESLEAIRENATREMALLPSRLRALSPATPPYPVEVSALPGPGCLRSDAPLRRLFHDDYGDLAEARHGLRGAPHEESLETG